MSHIISTKRTNHFFVALALCCFIIIFGCSTGPAALSETAPPHSEWVKSCTDWDEWDKPGPPFRIFGNSYYVGTCGITAILVTSDNGHILIDGSTEAGADIIASNIQSLGFSLKDVKVLLHSHEHFDHVAGLARLKQLTGARLLASPEARPTLETGVAADSDPQAGMHQPFPAVPVDGIIQEGETVKLATLALTPIATPGHTAGALSWQWQSCEKQRCLSIVYADSLSPVSNDSYHFSDHPIYLKQYRVGLEKLAALDCSILLTAHPSLSNMPERLSATGEGLVDTQACKAFAEVSSTRLNQRLSKEQAGKTP